MCVNDLETRDHALLFSLSLFPRRCDDSAVDVIIYCQITPLFLRPQTSSLIVELALEWYYMIIVCLMKSKHYLNVKI